MNVQLPLEEQLREDGAQHLPLIASRILHNKVTAYATFFLKNYTDYLSFQFLFLQANQPIREEIPNMGVLLLIECPFLLYGIYTAVKRKIPYGKFAVLWFLLVPAVISVASDETPNIHRFFLAMLPIHLLVALGVVTTYTSIAKRYHVLFVCGLSAVYIFNVFYFLHQLYVHQPIHAPIYRNAPDKELTLYLKSVYTSYDVVVSQKVLEDMLFFWPIDPATYQREGSPRDTDNAWYRNFLFVTDACPSKILNPNVQALKQKKILYVDKAECSLEENDNVIKTIKYKNTLNAYFLIEKKAP